MEAGEKGRNPQAPGEAHQEGTKQDSNHPGQRDIDSFIHSFTHSLMHTSSCWLVQKHLSSAVVVLQISDLKEMARTQPQINI